VAFLRTFAAMTVAALVWIGVWVLFDDADSNALNAVADWISPLSVTGWILYAAIAVGCYFLAVRLLGNQPPSSGRD
jgi:hypothetical protein